MAAVSGAGRIVGASLGSAASSLASTRVSRRAAAIVTAAGLAMLLSLASCAPAVPAADRGDEERAAFAEHIDDVGASSQGSSDGDGSEPEALFAIDQSAVDAVRAEVEAVLASYAGDYTVSAADVAGRWAFDVRGDEARVSASMVKLPVLGAFWESVQAGACLLDDTVVLAPDDIVGGSGVVQASGAGSTWTYGQLAFHMIADSDNVATNVLIERVGMSAVNEYAQRMGLGATQLNRLMMDADAPAENYMSANDVAALLVAVADGSFVSSEASAFAFEALQAQSDATGLLQGLPAGTAFAHKTGTLVGVENDGGIVCGSQPYVLVVMGGNVDEASAQACMAEVAALVDGWVAEHV